MSREEAARIAQSLFVGHGPTTDNYVDEEDDDGEYDYEEALSDREAELVSWQGYADDMRVRASTRN